MSKWRRYFKGRKAEYRTINYLKKQGYKYAFRSAGSHGPIDVVGIRQGQILFIQVKAGRSFHLSAEEKQVLTDVWMTLRWGDPRNVVLELWYWGPRARVPVAKSMCNL